MQRGSTLELNMSRSGASALYVFADGDRVGVDIEQLRRVPEADAIALQHVASITVESVDMSIDFYNVRAGKIVTLLRQ